MSDQIVDSMSWSLWVASAYGIMGLLTWTDGWMVSGIADTWIANLMLPKFGCQSVHLSLSQYSVDRVLSLAVVPALANLDQAVYLFFQFDVVN